MLRDLALAAKAACSKEDQESLVGTIKILKDLGEKAKKRGILSLEEEQSKISDPFLQVGLQLIVDKTDPDVVCNILDSDIYYNESNGRELLKKILVREGLLRIQKGENARNILLCTKVFLGKIDRDTFNKLMESDH